MLSGAPCRFLLVLLLFLLSAASDVNDEIQAVLRDMQRSRAEQDRLDMQVLEDEKMLLQNVSPAVGTGKSCHMALPLHMSDQEVAGGPGNLHEAWTRSLIDDIWNDPRLSGHTDLTVEELAALNVNASHRRCRPSTFGESVADYEKAFADHRFGLGHDDVYFDLGGGVGKAVMYAFLKFNLSRAISVELSTTRFDRSCQALQRLEALVQSDAAKCGTQCRARMASPGHIEMIHQNMLDVDLSQATIVTMWALCLPEEVMSELLKKLLSELREGTRVYDRGYGWKYVKDWNKELVVDGKKLRFLGDVKNGGAAYLVETHRPGSENTEL